MVFPYYEYSILHLFNKCFWCLSFFKETHVYLRSAWDLLWRSFGLKMAQWQCQVQKEKWWEIVETAGCEVCWRGGNPAGSNAPATGLAGRLQPQTPTAAIHWFSRGETKAPQYGDLKHEPRIWQNSQIWPWTNYSISLCSSFLICRMGIIKVPNGTVMGLSNTYEAVTILAGTQ